MSMKSGSVARGRYLVFLSLSEPAWVLPCFVQCFVIFIDSNQGEWSPTQEGWGCDLQGFYSVYSATSGQLMGMLGAFLTSQAVKQADSSTTSVSISCLSASALSLLIALLPFIGVGEFKYG